MDDLALSVLSAAAGFLMGIAVTLTVLWVFGAIA